MQGNWPLTDRQSRIAWSISSIVMSFTLANCWLSDFEISLTDAPSPSSTRALWTTGETQRLFNSLVKSLPAFSTLFFTASSLPLSRSHSTNRATGYLGGSPTDLNRMFSSDNRTLSPSSPRNVPDAAWSPPSRLPAVVNSLSRSATSVDSSSGPWLAPYLLEIRSRSIGNGESWSGVICRSRRSR